MKKVASFLLMLITITFSVLTVTQPAYARDVGKQCVSLTVFEILTTIPVPAVAEHQYNIVQAPALQCDVGIGADMPLTIPAPVAQASPPFKWQTDNAIEHPQRFIKKDSYANYAATLPGNIVTMARWKDLHRRS